MTTVTLDTAPVRPSAFRWLAGGLAIAFGLGTLFEGGRVLFSGPAAMAAAGKVVLFVLIFNFSAGFAYVLTGLATIAQRPWAAWVARALALTTLLVFAAFGIHVLLGGAFELRTAVALALRSLFWTVQALTLPRLLPLPRRAE